VLVGGILDGVHVRIGRSRPAFLWIDTRRGHMPYREPGKHRVLYRRVTWREGFARVRAGYLYAGNTHGLCEDCGAYVERVGGHRCGYCGGKLVVTPSG
jgi:hypothetical protein